MASTTGPSLEPFHHDPLPDSREYIRLVKIKQASKSDALTISIKSYPRSSAPPYSALSYTWGDRQLSKTIIANYKLLQITENCWYALGQLRLHGLCRHFWIDALCINQADDVEKSAQVNLMGATYRNAEFGAIALGRHDRATQYLFAKLAEIDVSRGLEDTQTILEYLDQDCLERLCRGLTALGMRSYWNRLWIVQEFALPPKTILFCGTSSICFDAIASLRRALREMMRSKIQKLSTQYDKFLLDATPMTSTIKLRRTIRDSTDGVTAFEKLMDLLGPRECIDTRDRIFGILSLVKWEVGVTPLTADYSISRCELATRTLRLYKGQQLDVTTRVLQMLDIGPRDPGIWEIWQHRMLQQAVIPIPCPPLRPGQRTSFFSAAAAFRISDSTTISPLSERWRCLLNPLQADSKDNKLSNFEEWLESRPILVPATTQIGDLIVKIARPLFAKEGAGDHDYFDRSAMIIRKIDGEDDNYTVLGHVLFFPENDISSLSPYKLDVSWEYEFQLHVDDDDLLFWAWQQIHWGSKTCETVTDCDQKMEVFAADFCHQPLSSYATAWPRPRYQRETSLDEIGRELTRTISRHILGLPTSSTGAWKPPQDFD